SAVTSDASADAARPAGEPQRTTAEDLAAAEEAAFLARLARLGLGAETAEQQDHPSAPTGDGGRQGRSERLSRTVRTAPAGDGRGTGRPARTDRSEAARPAADQRGKTPDGAAPAPSRGDEGVFSRVAENARRLSSLLDRKSTRLNSS